MSVWNHDSPSDRRQILRDGLNRWVKNLVERTEDRVVQQRYVRPPGALPEVGFLAACTRCGACAPVCPPGAIRTVPPSGGLAAGTPMLEPAIEPCIACADMPCVAACPTGALTLPDDGWQGYRLGTVEFVPERCITFKGTACRVCVDACPIGDRALGQDEAGRPILRHEGCVGCGVCVRKCVTSPSSFRFQPVRS